MLGSLPGLVTQLLNKGGRGGTLAPKGNWDCLAPARAAKLLGLVSLLECCPQRPADNYIRIYICKKYLYNVAVLFCSCFNSRKVSGFVKAHLRTCFLSSRGPSRRVNADGPTVKARQVWGKESSVRRGWEAQRVFPSPQQRHILLTCLRWVPSPPPTKPDGAWEFSVIGSSFNLRGALGLTIGVRC